MVCLFWKMLARLDICTRRGRLGEASLPLSALCALLVFACIPLRAGIPLWDVELYGAFPIELKTIGEIEADDIDESSGLAASEKYPGVFWTHNDSGDTARIFAIHADGSLAGPSDGIRVDGAVNHDWEDIARGPGDTLFIADTGNNANKRRNLAVYLVPEPDPQQRQPIKPLRTLRYSYPDQQAFPGAVHNFDCEAVFYAAGSLWVLTKHRSDARTTLYRFPSTTDASPQLLERIADINLRGMVTAADVTDDGRRLAILTYGAVWLFEGDPGNWFAGKGWWLPFWNGNVCEGLCFTDGGLLISSEGRSMFKVPFDELRPIRGMVKKDESPAAPQAAKGGN